MIKYSGFFLIGAIVVIAAITLSWACKKENTPATTAVTATSPPAGPQLIFVFRFDSTQARLNNFGQPDTMPTGHSGESPVINSMSSHYIELAPTALTQLGSGDVLYRAPEVGSGANLAIEFSKEVIVGAGVPFYSCPISSVTPGSYEYLRVSLAYQNYTIRWAAPAYNITNAPGTIASFVGFNTYIGTYKIKDSNVTVNANKAQGYWGFEDPYSVATGQAPVTTVPNPIASTSPIPSGSCVVTGQFTTPFTVSGNETKNDTIIVSLSINKSFEFTDPNHNGMYEPLNGDTVVNMGIRGLIPIVK
jgi:hypothetical protein